METKRNKILKNVCTRWISMLASTNQMMEEYHTFSLKMGLDAST
jgi:hypothetical protein